MPHAKTFIEPQPLNHLNVYQIALSSCKGHTVKGSKWLAQKERLGVLDSAVSWLLSHFTGRETEVQSHRARVWILI